MIMCARPIVYNFYNNNNKIYLCWKISQLFCKENYGPWRNSQFFCDIFINWLNAKQTFPFESNHSDVSWNRFGCQHSFQSIFVFVASIFVDWHVPFPITCGFFHSLQHTIWDEFYRFLYPVVGTKGNGFRSLSQVISSHSYLILSIYISNGKFSTWTTHKHLD